jgi:OmpA-OmpF porin, OOP family
MNHASTSILLTLSLVTSLGCATKKYVRQQTTPLINKVNELDELTAQNTKAIKDTDERAQAGIDQAQARATAADQKALAAGQQAEQAQVQANNTLQNVAKLQNVVVNLDNYHVANQTSVQFGVNRDILTKDAKAALDQLAADISHVTDYIIVVNGYTDSTGSADYNYSLSRRRADTVIQYMASEHNVPAYKIYVIGLGKENPVDSNATRRGRAKNRRADVRLMTNAVAGATATAAVTDR